MRINVLRWWAMPVVVMLLSACVTNPATTGPAVDLPDTSAASQRSDIDNLKVPARLKDELFRLYDSDPVERAWGAYQLAKFGSGASVAVPHLVNLLSDNTEVVMSRYLGGGFHNSSATTPAEEAARALAKIGTPAIDSLVTRLQDADPQVRRLAAKALGQTGSMATVDVLLKAVADSDPRVRAAATISLGSLRHPVVAQKLIDAYANTSTELQPHIIYAMSRINDIIVVPFLIKQFSSSSVTVRSAIVLALGNLRDARAVETLLVALKDEDEIVRANAAFALSSFYSIAVMNALFATLDDHVAGVREAALESLRTLSGVDFGQDKQQWYAWWTQQQRAIQTPNEQQTPQN